MHYFVVTFKSAYIYQTCDFSFIRTIQEKKKEINMNSFLNSFWNGLIFFPTTEKQFWIGMHAELILFDWTKDQAIHFPSFLEYRS